MDEKPRYGVDGVYYIVGLVGGGLLLATAGIAVALVGSGLLQVGGIAALTVGLVMLIPGFLGIKYVRIGKFLLRDRLLSMTTWRGNEQVLDVGTGGALMRSARRSGRPTVMWSG
jgi:arsenite methyltransferase